MANGRSRREILIAYSGGKCALCGYARNKGALSFHHIDPGTKSFDLGVKNCNRRNLMVLKAEADKCILLCNNCHAELHYPNLSTKEPLLKRIVRSILNKL